jgi:hypothetical protein
VEAVVAFANKTSWVKAIMPFGKCRLHHPAGPFLTVCVGAMHQMQGVNTANQLMASNGQPNALWQKFINP